MTSYRIWMFLAALAAVAAGPGARGAFADPETGSEKDELAGGDWHGEKTWDHHEGGGGAGTPTPAPGTTPPAPGGTATPPCTENPPPLTGTPTVPTGPAEPAEPAEPAGPIAPAEPAGPLFPPTPVPPMPPAVNACNARWVCEVVEAIPDLYEEETRLTLTLFRTDAFAFISNGYCRSESTWFVDGFTTTRAGHDGSTQFKVEVRLEHPCPNCKPKIDLKGISQIEARVQAKTPWGDLNCSTTASASASSTWAGDIDCADRCSATVSDGQGTGEISVGADPLKITKKTTSSYVLVIADGGKGDGNRIDEARTSLLIRNRGGVSTYAAGTDDNAQAKARVGYSLVIHGDSACGKWGEYEVVLQE